MGLGIKGECPGQTPRTHSRSPIHLAVVNQSGSEPKQRQ